MLLDRWGIVWADFRTAYGYDLEALWFDRGLSWRWFIAHFVALPSTSLTKALFRSEYVDEQADISAENAEAYLRGVFG